MWFDDAKFGTASAGIVLIANEILLSGTKKDSRGYLLLCKIDKDEEVTVISVTKKSGVHFSELLSFEVLTSNNEIVTFNWNCWAFFRKKSDASVSKNST